MDERVKNIIDKFTKDMKDYGLYSQLSNSFRITEAYQVELGRQEFLLHMSYNGTIVSADFRLDSLRGIDLAVLKYGEHSVRERLQNWSPPFTYETKKAVKMWLPEYFYPAHGGTIELLDQIVMLKRMEQWAKENGVRYPCSEHRFMIIDPRVEK